MNVEKNGIAARAGPTALPTSPPISCPPACPRSRFLLDLYTDYLLVSFGQASATGLASLMPQVVSHDQITRFLSRNAFGGADLWQIVKPHVRKIQSDDACLIFDDTVEEKAYTETNEIITFDNEACLTIYLEQVEFPLLLILSTVTNDSGKTGVLYLVTSDLTFLL